MHRDLSFFSFMYILFYSCFSIYRVCLFVSLLFVGWLPLAFRLGASHTRATLFRLCASIFYLPG